MIRIPAPGYEVYLGRGLIDRIGELLPPRRAFIVTDENVAAAGWPARAADALGERVKGIHVLRPGEAHKTMQALETLLDALLDAQLDREDMVIAVGGGMVGDMAGFAAAIAKRGCAVAQIATSLLGQADAAIGGKTGINARQGKNLIGAFHRPAAVLIDVAALDTLPARELRCGYAEIVKYSLIGDAGLFAWCEANAQALIAGDEDLRLQAIETSVRAKLAIVSEDELDVDGRRALLNFGHSFGHAIETETGTAHGEAIALGMVLAFRLSVERELCAAADAERVARHLGAVGLPTRLDRADPTRLVHRMRHDKKSRDGRLRLVLTSGIGTAVLEEIEPADVEAFLERERSARLAVG